MKQIMHEIKKVGTSQNIPIIPTLGNNDFIKHDQSTSAINALEVYSKYYDYFFTNNMVQPVDKETFLKGGYYRWDMPDRMVSILALNTVTYMTENEQNIAGGEEQLRWMEHELMMN